jgi:5'-3' exonuclease
MGIPAYYKKLTHSVPGLVSTHHHEVAWLFMDFNCLIYYCIGLQPEYDGDTWENGLIESVVSCCKEIVKEVKPTEGVYIAIDGVVPMAKMRQQRLRRFKSVWEQGRTATDQQGHKADQQGHKALIKKWNTNAITPGTVFMDKLCTRLQTMCDEKRWMFSGCLEPGEGEHKIMAQWRRGIYKGPIAVYGLDADLIVLSLLGQAMNQLGSIWLFREVKPLESATAVNALKPVDQLYEWFSIDMLRDHLMRPSELCKNHSIISYCFAMSILGNDFLPSSLGLKMRDGGHDELLHCLLELIDADMNIIEENLIELFRRLSQTEHHRIMNYIKVKQRQASYSTEKGLGEQNWPLSQIEDLRGDWVARYTKLAGPSIESCKEYINGIKWIWSYYTGKSVCYNWYYPYVLPPLWSILVTYLNSHNTCLQSEMPICVRIEELRPVEQLVLVLPLESWSLIPACPEKVLSMIAPQFFPSTFEFESVGKRFFWECEAMIPILTVLELKELIRAYYP